MMRRYLSFLTAVIFLGGVAVAQADSPKVIAAKFHADWCASCKALDPTLDKIKKSFSNAPVLFVTLDRTDEATVNNSAMLASSLGIGQQFSDYQKTGFVLLIDANSKQTLAKLTKDLSFADMSKAVTAALEGKKTEWSDASGSKKGSMKKGSMKDSDHDHDHDHDHGSSKGSMKKGSGY